MRSEFWDGVEGISGCKNFVGKRKKFIFNAFVDLKPMERFENRSDMCGFRSLDNSASKRIARFLCDYVVFTFSWCIVSHVVFVY